MLKTEKGKNELTFFGTKEELENLEKMLNDRNIPILKKNDYLSYENVVSMQSYHYGYCIDSDEIFESKFNTKGTNLDFITKESAKLAILYIKLRRVVDFANDNEFVTSGILRNGFIFKSEEIADMCYNANKEMFDKFNKLK